MAFSGRKKVVFAVAFGLSLGLLCVIGIELLLRTSVGLALGPHPKPPNPRRPGALVAFPEPGFIPVHASRHSKYLYIADSRLLWRLKPGTQTGYLENYAAPNPQITINDQGFRGLPRLPERNRGVLRIVCLGDSVTFGFGLSVGDGDTFPAIIEGALNRERPHWQVEVLNFGCPGYSSFQGQRWLTEALAFEPHLVLIGFGHNDLSRRATTDEATARRYDTFGMRLALAIGPLEAVRLYRGLTAPKAGPSLHNLGGDGGPNHVQRVAPEGYGQHLRGMVQAVRDAGATPWLLDPMFVEARGRQLRPHLETVARETATPLFSLPDLIATADPSATPEATTYFQDIQRAIGHGWRQVFMDDPIHPNALGNRVIGEALAEEVLASPLAATFEKEARRRIPSYRPQLMGKPNLAP